MIWLATAVTTAGALLCLTAAIGLLRARDALSRLQVVTKASSFGIALTVIGTIIAVPQWDVSIQTILTAVFLMTVAPISGHLVARAVYRSGLIGQLATDDLARHAEPAPESERGTSD